MLLHRRRILEDLIGNAAVGHHVRPFLHLHGHDRGHRLDPVDVDLGQLLHEGEDGVELFAQVLDFVLGNRNARELRDTADGIGGGGHGCSWSRSGWASL